MHLLPYATLGVVVLSFGLWLHIKQVEVVDNPPGPNMWVVVLLHMFFLGVGLIAPFFVDFAEQQNVFLALAGIGIVGATFALLIGAAKLLSRKPK